MDMMTRIATLTADCLASTWPEAQGLPTADEIRGLLAVPPNREMGDYAFPVFRLAKALRMGPPVIAQKLVAAWTHEDVARAEAVNGYVNFFLNRVNFAADTLNAVFEKGEKYGSSDLGAGKTAFTRGFASVIAPEAAVCSPTYAIVNEYTGKSPLFHFDMYRIEDEDSLDSIGFYDYFGRGVIITEWSENIPYALPEHYIKVTIEKRGDDARRILAEKC